MAGRLPPAEEAIKMAILEPAGAGPLSRAQLMEPMNIGSASDLTAEERARIMRNMPMEPVSKGKEVGVRKAASKSEVYEKKLASGGYTKAADGCCKRGKTRGKFV